MKHLLLLLVLIGALINQRILAQSDPNNDPNWDWRASTVFTVYPQANGGNPINTTSPFYQGGISIAVQDNEPIDGWRLVIRDFGWTQRAVPVPHFILLAAERTGAYLTLRVLQSEGGFGVRR